MTHKSMERALRGERQPRAIALAAPDHAGAALDPALLAGAIGCSGDPLLIVDGFDRICLANAAAAALLGMSIERLTRTRLREHLLAGDGEAQRDCAVLERVKAGPCPRERTLLDGRAVRAVLTPLRNSFGGHTHVCITLSEVSRQPGDGAFDALGRLASELAHDINNQLSAALNYVFILRRRVGISEQTGQHLEELQAAAWRAAGLTGTLKLLGRRRSAAPEPLHVSHVVERLEPLLRHLARERQLEITLALVPDLPEVQLPLAYLEQLIVLLALYAMGRAPNGSRLELRAEPSRADDGVGVRLQCELREQAGERPVHGATAATHANAALRRALKRCHARMGHDPQRIWVELAQ